MKKFIVKRHFISNNESLKEFVLEIDAIKKTIAISKANNYGYEFGLVLSVDEGNIDKDLRDRIIEERKKLPKDLLLIYNQKKLGSSASLMQTLSSPIFSNKKGAFALMCLDQYITDSKEALEWINNIFEKVQKNNALYANGSRDIPVILAIHKKNSNLRIIHELFHSLTIGSDKLKIDKKKQG